MQLKNSFDVARPPAQAWSILLDIPKSVTCMAGVELTSVEPDGSYKGKLSVKLGPVALKFNGTATLEDVDEVAHSATIRAKGSDLQGRGSAGATARIRVVPNGNDSTVLIETDLQLSGLVAQYGRASSVISAMAGEMVSTFATNLRTRMLDAGVGGSTATTGATTSVGAPATGNNAIDSGLIWRALWAWFRSLFGAKSSG
jgi:carbon monoxide dehydrogenase subunit G